MARSRESRTLEFEDGDLPALEEKPRRPRATPKAAPAPSSRRRILFAVVFLFFLVVMIAAVALAYQVDTFLATDPRFTLRPFVKEGLVLADGPIRVEGMKHVATREVLNLFADDVGRSLYLLPMEARREQIRAIDWVQEASITRLWPNRLQIVVTERVPVALAALPTRRRGDAYRMMLVDGEGQLMRRPRQGAFDLPVVFGLSPDQSIEFRKARIDLLLRMQQEVQPLNARFSELELSDPNNLSATLTIDGRSLRLFLGKENYLERVQVFLERSGEILKLNPQANVFDMRVEGRIIASREGLNDGR